MANTSLLQDEKDYCRKKILLYTPLDKATLKYKNWQAANALAYFGVVNLLPTKARAYFGAVN
jgi:hypothetical protein